MATTQTLPPKFCAHYAERARNGDYEYKIGHEIYAWFQHNQKIVVVGEKSPMGHLTQFTTKQAEIERKLLEKYKKSPDHELSVREVLARNFPLHYQRIVELIHLFRSDAELFLADKAATQEFYNHCFVLHSTVEGSWYWSSLFWPRGY